MTPKEAVKLLNKYRNNYYNSPMEEERSVAQALNIYLPQQEKKDKLLELYRELHETPDTITYKNLLEQIKALEETMK